MTQKYTSPGVPLYFSGSGKEISITYEKKGIISMYIATVALLLFVFPIVSVGVTLFLRPQSELLLLVGQWFTFWAVGVRLGLAGIRQTIQPGFTSKEILGIEGREVYVVVRELGFANLTFGLLGLVSLWHAAWLSPAAFAGGLYYGLAGVGHLFKKDRNLKEQVATYSDLVISVILLGFFTTTL
jgi:hypothetical protein